MWLVAFGTADNRQPGAGHRQCTVLYLAGRSLYRRMVICRQIMTHERLPVNIVLHWLCYLENIFKSLPLFVKSMLCCNPNDPTALLY